MNKIFKVVWSKVRNCYVVVSEIAKNIVSGVGKRNRIKRASLAATLAASVLTSGFFLSNEAWAATDNLAEVATLDQYIVIAGNGWNSYAGNADTVEVSGVTYYIVKKDGKEIHYYKDTINTNKDFYVLKGYEIVSWEEQDSKDGTNNKVTVVTKIEGNSSEGNALTTLQHKSFWLKDDNGNYVSTVLNDSLNDVHLSSYGAVTNGGGYVTPKTWGYNFDWNGDKTTEERINNGIATTGTTTLERVELAEDGNYYYNNELLSVNNVYFLGDDAQSTTSDKIHAYVFVKDNKVYEGLVYGDNGEILLTGLDGNGVAYTYWGAEADTHNTLLRDSGMTVYQLHETFHGVQENITKLSYADIKKVNVAADANGNGGTIGFSYNKQNDNGYTEVPGTINITKGTNGDGDNTIVFSNTVDETTNSFAIDTGSKVRVSQSSDKKTTEITVNDGTPVVVTDTNTQYEVSAATNNATTNIVNTYTFKEKGATEGVEIVDTDTKVVSGEANYSSSKINLTNSDGTTAEITGLHDYYVTGGSVTYDAHGGTGELTLNREGLDAVEITGLQNTYTTDLSVTGGSNDATISFNRNDGTNKYGLTLLGSDSVQIVTDANGIHFSATDTYVTGGNTHYDGNGTGTATLTTNKDSTTATITGLKNTFVSDVSLNGNVLTFSYNDSSNPKEVNLSSLVSSLGTMNNWHAKVGSTSFEVTNNETVEYAAGKNINLGLDDASSKITVATKSEVEFDSVTVGGSNNSPQVVIDNAGINMNNQNITGLADGIQDNDAVNLKQLKDSRTVVAAGTNVESVDVSQNAGGGTIYTINVKDTTYTASTESAEGGNLAANQKSKYTIRDNNGNNLVTIVDTDTDTNTKTLLEAGGDIQLTRSDTGDTITYTVSATDTTLKDDTAVYNSTDNSFTITDSSNHTTKLENVARASDLQTVANKVENNITSIENILDGDLVKIGVDATNNQKTIALFTNGSKSSGVAVSSAVGQNGQDATITFNSAGSSFSVSAGSTVIVEPKNDTNEMDSIIVNGNRYYVEDTTLDTNTSLSSATDIKIGDKVIGKNYVVADTAGNNVNINDVASASALKEVIENVTGGSNSITNVLNNILNGDLQNGDLFEISTSSDGKINLTNTNTDVASSVDVKVSGGVENQGDVKVTFGTGEDAFSVTTGSIVTAASTNNVLTQLTINGHAYDLVHAEEIQQLNNLSVDGGTGKLAYNTHNSDANEKHSWQIIDIGQKDANGNSIVYKDTTLDTEEVKESIASGYKYTIYDTAGNSVVLEDVASASKLQTVANDVSTNATNISNLTSKVNVNTENITNIMDGKVVKLNVVGTNNQSKIALVTNNDVTSEINVSSAVGTGGNDATLTFSGEGSNKFVVDVGSTVRVQHDDGSNVAKGITVNNVNYTIADTQLQNDTAVRTTNDGGVTYQYKITDSSGHYTYLDDVASGTKLKNVIENVQSNTDNITNILGGSLMKIGVDTTNNQKRIALYANGEIKSDVDVSTTVGTGGNDATLTFSSEEGQFSVNVGSTVRVHATDTVNNEDVMHGITVNGDYFVVEDTQLDTVKSVSTALTNNAGVVYGRDYAVVDTSGKTVRITDVASANYVDASVNNINQDITNLSERIDAEAAKDVIVKNTDHNIYVNTTTNEEGDITYALSLAANVNVDSSIKVGEDIELYGDGIVKANALIANERIEVGEVLISPSTITGLANRTWDSTNIVSGRAATEDQLQSAVAGVTTNLTNNYNTLHNDDIKEIFVNPTNGTVALHRYSATEVSGTLQFSSGGGYRVSEGGTVAYPDTYITISNSSGSIKLDTGSKVVGNVHYNTGNAEQLTSLQINGKDYIIPAWDIDENGEPIFQDYHLHNEDNLLGVISDGEKFAEAAGTELLGYKVDDTGVLQLHVLDRHNEDKRVGIVNIGNIATKSSVDDLTAKVEDIDSRVDVVENDINNIKNNITNINVQIADVSGDSIKGGSINSDGTITLEKSKENGSITLEGRLENHALEAHTDKTKAYRADNDGVVELVTVDKYNSNSKHSTYIADVASKEKLDALSDTVGATSTEGLKESYAKTTYLKETKAEDGTVTEKGAENLVDADVKLDAAIKANADLSYNNDVILQNQIQNQTQYLDSRINQVNSRVNKVGAGAAALAALHPMDFDPDDKLSFAVGAGNYAGENATALGAFYRPNEKVMMSVGGTYGNGENMVNMGVSFALDRTNNISNSRTAMAKEIVDLREQVANQGQQIAQLVALVNQLVGTPEAQVPGEVAFPDVPQNHWAYEYVNSLIGKGLIKGYPDGTFGGDRTMTRYEFAAILFRAMEQGVVLSEQIRQEFEPELGRIRVDRVKGTDADLNKIERVRVNRAVNRDDYGTKVVQVKH